ncbi:DUF559 domain-containing protein [Pseudonocardia sp.]|uniref:DUF559 domain-containing protein n=1 Tax=Pseudonocardia sp. TaxID=60912 RepID=UPI003D0D734F
MIDQTRPFRGSHALAAGHVTRGVLFGPRYVRLLPDVYVAASVPVDLPLRALAAAELIGATGALAGYAAAELHGAPCSPRPDEPVDVVLRPPHQRRPVAGLRVHRDMLLPGELELRDGVTLTSPLRTACDIGRWARDLTAAVVALDALAWHAQIDLDVLRAVAARRGPRGVRRLREAARFARFGAESPMETRVRLVLLAHGLPEPVLQHRIVCGDREYRLDLAYPQFRLAIEYDGGEHRSPERARSDLARQARLTAAGWTVLRFSAAEIHRSPRAVAARVRQALAECARIQVAG